MEPYWSARGTAGRRYGGASYPAPISLAAVVVPTAGRAAKPLVPLSSQHLAAPIAGGLRILSLEIYGFQGAVSIFYVGSLSYYYSGEKV